MTCIALIEDRAGLEACLATAENGTPRCVAMTAEGAAALAEHGLTFLAPHEFFDQPTFTALAHELFDRLYAVLEAAEASHPALRNLLLDNLYNLYYALISVIARAHLLAAAATHARPSAVVCVAAPPTDWPLVLCQEALQRTCAAFDIPCTLVAAAVAPRAGGRSVFQRALRRNVQILRSHFASWRRRDIARQATLPGSGTVLYAGGPDYDWQLFMEYARACLPGLRHHALTRTAGCAPWEVAFESIEIPGQPRSVQRFAPRRREDRFELPADALREFPVSLPGATVDFGDTLREVVARVLAGSRAILDQTREIARQVAGTLAPQVVCFSELTTLSSRVLCREFNRRGVPTICYQNGGVYGVQQNPLIEEMVQCHARYFFSYGPAIVPQSSERFATTTGFVPAGSLRLHDIRLMNVALRQRAPAGRKLEVLWISEGTTRNTLGLWYQTEDAQRFALQQQGLALLAAAPDLRIVFRPIPSQVVELATPGWVAATLPAVVVDDYSESRYLIQRADLVVCDVHSNTSWDEALACGKPLLLFVDPAVTRLRADFMACLDDACDWARTPAAFLERLRAVARSPRDYLNQYRKSGDDYLARYAVPGLGALRCMADIIAQATATPSSNS